MARPERQEIWRRIKTLERVLTSERQNFKNAQSKEQRGIYLDRVEKVEEQLRQLDIRFNGFVLPERKTA